MAKFRNRIEAESGWELFAGDENKKAIQKRENAIEKVGVGRT